MPGLLPNVDPNGLDEFSVVFTDRSLNHMSAKFQGVMRDISSALKEVYKAEGVALIPGGGSFAMEAVARQFTSGKHALILRNGWFSYRWSQIFEAGNFTSETSVIMARPSGNTPQSPYAPPPIEEVVSRIHDDKPDMVFAPHVETSAGLILPDDGVDVLISAPQKGWSASPSAGMVMLSAEAEARLEQTSSSRDHADRCDCRTG